MYRVWYSTESFADYIIDHTILGGMAGGEVIKNKMYESDANNPNNFHKMPDHIRKILYLDAPDIIVEYNAEPLFAIEVTTEAGTGHNAFQRFARIAASAENSVPIFYIYPEGAIISRRGTATKWDTINPLIFKALDAVMSIYDIPALLYYYPSDIANYLHNAINSPHIATKGLINDADIVRYPACPDGSDIEMQELFNAINTLLNEAIRLGVIDGRKSLLRNFVFRNRRDWMLNQFAIKSGGNVADNMSPLSAVTIVPTKYISNYLSSYETGSYRIGDLLGSRNTTALYQVNAKFRGDPYPGALAAIDYLKCRIGKTFEDRTTNLILVFGKIVVDEDNETIEILDDKGSDISDFFKDVKSCARHNLLTSDYPELIPDRISRYFMQVRYGSTYSKVKHIRVYSYFADAIFFPNGSLWRDA